MHSNAGTAQESRKKTFTLEPPIMTRFLLGIFRGLVIFTLLLPRPTLDIHVLPQAAKSARCLSCLGDLALGRPFRKD